MSSNTPGKIIPSNVANNTPDKLKRISIAIARDAWNSYIYDDLERAKRLAPQALAQPHLPDGFKAPMQFIMDTPSHNGETHPAPAVHNYKDRFTSAQHEANCEYWLKVARKLRRTHKRLEQAKEDCIRWPLKITRSSESDDDEDSSADESEDESENGSEDGSEDESEDEIEVQVGESSGHDQSSAEEDEKHDARPAVEADGHDTANEKSRLVLQRFAAWFFGDDDECIPWVPCP